MLLSSGSAWPPRDDEEQDDPSALPPLIRALPDQLGLKLEPIKAPTELLVIDRLEKPTEN